MNKLRKFSMIIVTLVIIIGVSFMPQTEAQAARRCSCTCHRTSLTERQKLYKIRVAAEGFLEDVKQILETEGWLVSDVIAFRWRTSRHVFKVEVTSPTSNKKENILFITTTRSFCKGEYGLTFSTSLSRTDADYFPNDGLIGKNANNHYLWDNGHINSDNIQSLLDWLGQP